MDIIIPTAFFPSIEYIACHLMASNTFIEKHETYPKQSLRNRYYIATSQGIQHLSIPVIKTLGNNTPINNIVIDFNSGFQKKHLKTLYTAYKSTPFFDYYFDSISDCINQKEESLLQFNTNAFIKICEILKIKKEIIFTHDYQKNILNQLDFRPKICNKNNDFKYNFTDNNLMYYQVFEDKIGFQKNLSIIDLIFNEGPNSIPILKASIHVSY